MHQPREEALGALSWIGHLLGGRNHCTAWRLTPALASAGKVNSRIGRKGNDVERGRRPRRRGSRALLIACTPVSLLSGNSISAVQSMAAACHRVLVARQ
jgi:hypothetical protein